MPGLILNVMPRSALRAVGLSLDLVLAAGIVVQLKSED